MLAKVMWCLLIVATVTVAGDDVIVRRAVGLAGNPCRAIGQEVNITGQHDLDGCVDATAPLRQFFVRFGRNLRHSLTPYSPAAEVRSRNFLPRDLFYCYHRCCPFYPKG